MNIILALDGSPCSERALEMLLTQLSPTDAEVHVLHADDWPRNLPPAFTFTAGPDAAAHVEHSHELRRRQAQTMLDDAVRRLQSAGFNASSYMVEGDPRQVILDAASAWPADLVILGSHGRSGLDRVLLGSVSDSVSRHARCSVQIVRSPRV
ncbi:MAG: universal stress protein [Vicinamibacterales bacterium]